jgi:hypothetical protein
VAERLRIVVLGYVVRGPLGGHAWHHLHYVAGLAALGHDVWFVEDSDDYPSCYNPVLDVTSTDPTYGLAFATEAFERIGLPERWAYHDAHTGSWRGPAAEVAVETCISADIVLNLSGSNPLRPWLRDVAVRVFLDTDPGFTQADHILREEARRRADQHTAFFTFAELVGKGAMLPEDGLPWRPTRQPVALDLWPVRPLPRNERFTTVMLWDSYAAAEVGGARLGLKSESFGPFLELATRSHVVLELALGGSTAPRDLLQSHGWQLVDPRGPTRTLDAYQEYIAGSLGEFSVAKHGYVSTHSGWFSERSANYLATGRPVITQDTGYTEVLPSGTGLLAFTTPDDALAALDEVARNPRRHSQAAREIAATCFDSRTVLSRMLDEAVAAPNPDGVI